MYHASIDREDREIDYAYRRPVISFRRHVIAVGFSTLERFGGT